MTIVAALLAVALVAVVHLLLRERRHAEAAWASERSELLNRIQRPDVVHLPGAVDFKVPEEAEPDDSHLVGQITRILDGEDE